MRMILLVFLTGISLGAAGGGQSGGGSWHLPVTAASSDVKGSVTRFLGDVRVTTDGVTIQADEADFHGDTRELELRGHVRAKFLR
jgi:hypothetical protein